ncbi:class II glutamine amidotransferase [Nioella nitratireducens]|uniref:class II glutamine amidotransferase n=1 Tax=Nioella nitratireducens TaxID=1287720 RepID=UPI0008FD4254|nr:class II glutamine amidotransferase [Nioella nitratireducens]
MCRWAAYIGAPIFLDEVISRPGHSLIAQSQHATEAKTETNGDGFGIAWYDARSEPGLYRDVYPAWSDPNLRSLAEQVRSRLFLAHVRASTGSAISRNNCHPFVVGRWSFMHNGQVGGFEGFRKHADMLVPDALYSFRKGATDSEVLFLIALAEGLETDPIAALSRACGHLSGLSRSKGLAPHLRLSAAFSDGKALYAARGSSDHIAPTVYYRWSASRSGWAVVSEPLEMDEGDWTPLCPGTVARFEGDKLDIFDLSL